MTVPNPRGSSAAAGIARLTKPAHAVATPLTVDRGTVLWRYAISLAVMHGLAVIVVLPWLFSWAGVIAFVLGIPLFSLGIGLGYHRLLTHNSLAVPKWLERGFVVLATCNMQDTPIKWVTAHRHHHKFSDRQADTHTPRASFLWSHIGWLFHPNAATRGPFAYQAYARDLLKDPFYRRLERDWRLPVAIFLAHAALFFLVGFAAGLLESGTAMDGVQFGLSLVAWGVVLRTVVVWHLTWSINSVTHMFGYRSYATRDHSRYNWLLGVVASGEGWHNNHHFDQASASNQHRWWEIDLTYYVIWLLERLGLATAVIRPRARRHAARPRTD